MMSQSIRARQYLDYMRNSQTASIAGCDEAARKLMIEAHRAAGEEQVVLNFLLDRHYCTLAKNYEKGLVRSALKFTANATFETFINDLKECDPERHVGFSYYKQPLSDILCGFGGLCALSFIAGALSAEKVINKNATWD